MESLLVVLAMSVIFIFIIVIVIYVAPAIFLNKFNKLVNGKGTALAWIPVCNVYLLGKLTVNKFVGWILVICILLNAKLTITFNGVEKSYTILPEGVRSIVLIIYDLAVLGLFIYAIVKYNQIKKNNNNVLEQPQQHTPSSQPQTIQDQMSQQPQVTQTQSNQKEENPLAAETESEKIPEFVEQPALHTEEIVAEPVTPTNNSYINVEQPTEEKQMVDEDITNAFDIKPVLDTPVETLDPIEEVANTAQINLENINGHVIPEVEPTEVLDMTDEIKPDKDILEETLELPKMANEEINSGITETKKCKNCGFENAYSSKNCYMCGEPLE